MRTMKNLRRLALPLLLAGGVAVLGASGADHTASGDAARAVPAASPPSAAVQAKQAMLLGHEGIDPKTQRRGATSRGGVTVYRSTNGPRTCLVDEQGGGHCPATDQIAEGRSFGGTLCSPGIPDHLTRVTGLVPTDAVRVVIRTGADTTYPLTPVDGTVAVEIPRVEAGASDHLDVTWTLDTGATKTIQVPMPPFISGVRCG